jgi:hypothetical protein
MHAPPKLLLDTFDVQGCRHHQLCINGEGLEEEIIGQGYQGHLVNDTSLAWGQ